MLAKLCLDLFLGFSLDLLLLYSDLLLDLDSYPTSLQGFATSAVSHTGNSLDEEIV